MTSKKVGLKPRKSAEAKREIAEKRRKNAEAKRVTAEESRERAEGTRKMSADKMRNEEEQRKVMEELRKTAEEMRRTVDTIRESTMRGIQLQERKREQAEQIRTDRIEELIQEALQGINILHREATSQLEEMKNILKSAKEIFHAMQEMLQKAPKPMKKVRS